MPAPSVLLLKQCFTPCLINYGLFGPKFSMWYMCHAKFWPKQHVPSDTSKQHILATHPSATCPSAFRARHAQGKRSCGLCGMYVCAHLWNVWRMCVFVVVVVVYKCAYCMCSVATDETSRPHHIARKGHTCTHTCRVTQPLNFKQSDVQKDSRHLITLYTVTRPPNTCVTNLIVAYYPERLLFRRAYGARA